MLWTSILSIVIGAVPAIVRELAKAKVDLANAETEMEKVAAQERIKALEARRDVLIAESNTPWTNIFRAAILAPISFYIAWTIAWDKIMCKWFMTSGPGVCETDKLGDWQLQILMIIIGYLFITDVTKILKR